MKRGAAKIYLATPPAASFELFLAAEKTDTGGGACTLGSVLVALQSTRLFKFAKKIRTLQIYKMTKYKSGSIGSEPVEEARKWRLQFLRHQPMAVVGLTSI